MRIISGVFFGLAGLFALAAVADEQSADASKKTLDDAGLRAAFAGKTHIGLYRRYLEAYGEQRFIETYTDNGNLQYTAGT
ncbi:MAG: hypothetical protein AAFY32_04245, partial [Pseudomonadota bacterium]